MFTRTKKCKAKTWIRSAHGSFRLFCFPSVLSEYLDVWDVDMMKRQDQVNKLQHHTDLYNSDYLIIRRGQEFQIKITFNRPYKPAEDKFAVEFAIGEQSRLSLFIRLLVKSLTL